MARALLKAWLRVIARLPEAAVSRAITDGTITALLERELGDEALRASFAPVRQELQREAQNAARYFARDIPVPAPLRTVAIGFDVLNPKVIDAIRALDTRVMQRLAPEVRETVRQHIERGLIEGVGPRTIARGLRSVVGLAPNQATYVENLRRELTEGRFTDAARRVLLDKRLNLERLAALPAGERAQRIERIVGGYRRRMIALNAETQARTATLDALKQGQRLAWEDAAAKGVVAREQLTKTWKGVMDEREREEHVEMEGETVPFDALYSTGQSYAGEGDWNCRCLDIVGVA
jgi:hypothetical protein